MLFPAYAGVILARAHASHGYRAFPRVCGGDPTSRKDKGGGFGFSPRMRG